MLLQNLSSVLNQHRISAFDEASTVLVFMPSIGLWGDPFLKQLTIEANPGRKPMGWVRAQSESLMLNTNSHSSHPVQLK
jgi:hypothetical protein